MTDAAFDAWFAQARAVPLEQIIQQRNIKLKRQGVELIGPCPKCGGEDRFGVSLREQLYNCRKCGAKGHGGIDFVAWLDGTEPIPAAEYLNGEPPPKANGKDHTPEPRKVRAARFLYPDENGETLFGVSRVEFQNPDGSFVLKDGKRKKTFSQWRPDPNITGKWLPGVEGVRVIPYRLPELIEAIGNEYTVLIVEGEAKVDALLKWNVPATCCAMGAGKWKPEHSEFLRGAEVVILPDNDKAGREHADVVGASLQGIAAAVHVLELPGLPSKGDIIDWASAGGTREQLDELLRQARPWAPREEAKAEETKTEERHQQQNNVFNAERLNQMTFSPIKYVVHGYIVEGLTLFAGKPKIGKSWLLLHVAFAVAEGGLTLGNAQCEQGDVLYAALEDNQRRLQSRLTKLFGTQGWPARLQFTCEMPRLTEGGLDFIKGWIESAERPRLVIIDTLAMVRMPNRKDQNSYDADYAAVKELRDIALKYGIAIVLVHHLRKAEADDPFDTISGTLGLTGAPDTIMILSRDSHGTRLHAKGRDLVEIEKAVKFDPGTCTWAILGDADAILKSTQRRGIVAALEEAGTEPLTPNQIAAHWGMKPANVKMLLARLLADGVVKKASYGKYILASTASQAAE
jgi:AAA domain